MHLVSPTPLLSLSLFSAEMAGLEHLFSPLFGGEGEKAQSGSLLLLLLLRPVEGRGNFHSREVGASLKVSVWPDGQFSPSNCKVILFKKREEGEEERSFEKERERFFSWYTKNQQTMEQFLFQRTLESFAAAKKWKPLSVIDLHHLGGALDFLT